jgi:hypothetical protein
VLIVHLSLNALVILEEGSYTARENEEILEEIEKRIEGNKDKIKERQCLVEHPFGTIKDL